MKGKKASWTEDTQVLFIDPKKGEHKLPFKDLVERLKSTQELKNRNLVYVSIMKEKENLPKFQAVNVTELEFMLRKSKSMVTNELFFLVDLNNPFSLLNRVKEKQYSVTLDELPDQTENTVKKARSDLSKGNFVILRINPKKYEDSETKKFVKAVVDKILDGEIKTHESRLITQITK